jgi:hypothetical protein
MIDVIASRLIDEGEHWSVYDVQCAIVEHGRVERVPAVLKRLRVVERALSGLVVRNSAELSFHVNRVTDCLKGSVRVQKCLAVESGAGGWFQLYLESLAGYEPVHATDPEDVVKIAWALGELNGQLTLLLRNARYVLSPDRTMPSVFRPAAGGPGAGRAADGAAAWKNGCGLVISHNKMGASTVRYGVQGPRKGGLVVGDWSRLGWAPAGFDVGRLFGGFLSQAPRAIVRETFRGMVGAYRAGLARQCISVSEEHVSCGVRAGILSS